MYPVLLQKPGITIENMENFFLLMEPPPAIADGGITAVYRYRSISLPKISTDIICQC